MAVHAYEGNTDLLKIVVEKRPAVFETDEIVCGHVEYDYRKESKLAQVTVNLRGHVETKYKVTGSNSSKTYRGGRELFCKQFMLYKGPIGPSHPKSWEFAIPFPNKVPPHPHARAYNRDRGGRDRFCGDEHPMPPSTSARERGLSGEITYSLNAKVSDLKGYRRYETKRQISYVPTMPVPARDRQIPNPTQYPHTFWLKTLRLRPEHSENLRMRDRAWSVFNSKEVPQWGFRITVELPKRSIPGCPVSVMLRLEHLAENPKDLPVPDVTLRYLNLRLHGKIHVQFEPRKRSSLGDVITVDAWTRQTHDLGEFSLESNYIKECNWRLSPSIPPDFETSYMWRTYVWRLEYQVECLGKKLTFVRDIPVVVEVKPVAELSAHHDVDFDESSPTTRSSTPPPRYEDVV